MANNIDNLEIVEIVEIVEKVTHNLRMWQGFWESSVYADNYGQINLILSQDKDECCKIFIKRNTQDITSVTFPKEFVKNTINEESMINLTISGCDVDGQEICYKLYGDQDGQTLQGIWESQKPEDAGTINISLTDLTEIKYAVNNNSWCSIM